MKFGLYLKENEDEGWAGMYLDYDQLKSMIRKLEEIHIDAISPKTTKGTSLSVTRPTNAAGVRVARGSSEQMTQEHFFSFLESEMKKIEQFTKKKVTEIRNVLLSVEKESNKLPTDPAKREAAGEALRSKVDSAAEEFLRLEKFVNLNFTGFHKILKKHDKRLPNPCKAFYITRLHQQSWVQGDCSDIIVMMSRVYSIIRGDEEVTAKESEKQDFVRSTKKYWVHTEDISRVKYIILQHLPVFLQKTMEGECDAQLVNSVYLDNRAMELYHGRLDKTPGAIALRMRWYGTSTPGTVFVERKTHRESWAGEVSVKERFLVNEEAVPDILSGKYNMEEEIAKMRKKGKSEDDIREWSQLVSEITQAINSKQLEPTLRTQYMRTAFQIPFDATVRISLDTNLCMINERTEDVRRGIRWYRNPKEEIPRNEITRFPHAVLEVKLQLEDELSTPQWVVDLLHSGMLMQVHKFSKYIHGCSTLMPDDVRAVPYWIDDPTLADSITRSGAQELISKPNTTFAHLLPHDASGKPKSPMMRRRSYRGNDTMPSVPPPLYREQIDEHEGVHEHSTNCLECLPLGQGWCEWASAMDEDMQQTTQKVEPKLIFANERTFIKWLHMAVIMASASIGVLAFAKRDSQAEIFALMLLPIALLFVIYPLFTYLWRNKKILARDATRWDDPLGPVLLTVLLIVAMSAEFTLKLMEYAYEEIESEFEKK